MARLHQVIYKEIPNDVYSPLDISEYFFYLNLIEFDSRLYDPYEKYETNQINIRNKILGQIIKEENVRCNVSSTIFGVSSLKDKSVIISEIQ